jgi:hypothetical protein
MSWEAFALYWFVMFPAALLCLQYGWDMICDEFVPMASSKEDQ